jgi:hypothetical protein
MSDSTTTGPATSEQEDSFAGLFAQLVMQQANMAMMLLGKVAHPETGKVLKDMEAARYFIDQLEMLEVKTKGNLTKEESALLKQSLMSLRLAFVDAVDSEPSEESAQLAEKPQGQPEPGSATAEKSEPQGSAEEEHRKKFSKKY